MRLRLVPSAVRTARIAHNHACSKRPPVRERRRGRGFCGHAGGEPVNVEFGDAREFHYDTPLGSPRQRFLTIDFDTNDKDDEPNGWTPAEPVAYTDYLGASAYNDGEITYDTQSSTWEISDTMNYLAGQWQKKLSTSEMQYYHGDLVGSTMLTTDDSGDDVSTVAYSAFGEILDASGSPGGTAPSGFPRYQYAGGHGYESGILSLAGVNPDLPPITLQHLGCPPQRARMEYSGGTPGQGAAMMIAYQQRDVLSFSVWRINDD